MIIAKSYPKIESLKKHTDELIKRYYDLKNAYGHKIQDEKVWDLLLKAVLYHDVGKVNNDFQSKINKQLKLNDIPRSEFGYIPHGFLSPFFLPVDRWKMSKKDKRVLIQAIAFHHERAIQPDVDLLETVYEKELISHFERVREEMDIELPELSQKVFKVSTYLKPEKRIKEMNDKDIYFLYVLVKGLLHRLDHAASAHVDIEIDTDFDIAKKTKQYLTQKFGAESLRSLQQFTYKHQDKNLIIVAQTGMGKTEASLLWAGKEKTFFTLPIRVSLNALYERVYREMEYKNVGLLHSSSLSHLDENGTERWDIIHDQSKNFSSKLLFTTIDQILKFPFKYKGYEKMFATMAYSKVIIDEIQAYNPWIVAVILKALEMIHRLGGRFMIMTATLPPIYIDELKKRKVIDENCIYEEFIDETFIRHRMQLVNHSIKDRVKEIKEQSKDNKVLIIVNTVKQAIELYQQFDDDNVNLLHSRFLPKDRALLEKEIKQFDQHAENGIWITTQLVEASIDIDFDVLHTELSTIDSLLQRFGRCYRKRQLDHKEPNIYIYTKEVSGVGTVYDKDIVKITEKVLRSFNGKVLNERDKVDLVNTIYAKEQLEGTEFYEKFKKAVYDLNHIVDYQITQKEAQDVLRGLDTVRVIPRNVFDEIIEKFESLEKEEDLEKRLKIRREIEQHIMSVPRKMYNKSLLNKIDFYYVSKSGKKFELFPDTFIIDVHYEFDEGEKKGVGLWDTKETSIW